MPAGEDDESLGDTEAEVPLDLTVDRVDIDHGSLRIHATMADGSADVRVSLGDACGRGEIGSGMATRSALVWTLGEAELAQALACDLVVRARVRAGIGTELRKANLPVAPGARAADSDEGLKSTSLAIVDGADEGESAAGEGEHGADDGERSVDEGAGATDERKEDPSDEREGAVFVGYRDFAFAVLSRRPFARGGSSIDPSVTVGGVALEAAP
jgi:hypothetical protein